MPRQGRIDYPGALHHVMVRGMEKRNLFRDDRDREAFLERVGRFITSTGNGCYAYALMPNHFHLLLVTGEKTVSSGRALACKWLIKDLKLGGREVASYLEITPSAVSALAERGVQREKELGITLSNDSHGDHNTPDKKRTCSQP